MKIQEFKELAEQQKEGCLRKPKNMLAISNSEEMEKTAFANMIINLIEAHHDYDEMYKIAGIEKRLKSFYNMNGSNNFKNPYTVETNFGFGSFCDVHTFFKKKYPNYIFKRYCHTNCFRFAKQENFKCKILSGIAYKNVPFLHSVILIDNYIIDFNYDLIMTKDLYLNLFNFEILNIVDSEEVKKNKNILNSIDSLRWTYGDIVFCFYEIVNSVNKNQDRTI